MERIAVIDFGMGNLHSVHKALSVATDGKAQIVDGDTVDDIAGADRVVFPGQGAARDCMNSLDAGGLVAAICDAAAEKPFLGICMGLQVLFERSEEDGGIDCLGLFAGKVSRFRRKPGAGRKIPHMGWNQVRHRILHPLWEGIKDGANFYFAHSYYPVPDDDGVVAGETDYGGSFTCAIASGLVFAVQFHPEKSATDGLRLLRNFAGWKGGVASC